MSEEAGRVVDQRLRAAVESSPSGLLMIDAAGTIVLVNREVERLFGYAREELLGRSMDMLVPERFRHGHSGFRAAFLRDPKIRAMGVGRELYGRRKDGTEVPVEIGLTPVATQEGMFVISAIVDISARKQAEAERRVLEDQLRQAQKMEAVGTLAGGIAHDFNNLLAAIIGYGELVRQAAAGLPGMRADADELLAAARRGRQVVDKILAFSRRHEVVREPLDLRTAVYDTQHLLRATLPTTIDLTITVRADTPRVSADATSVQQVLMNLATNAAQAMAGSGQVHLMLEPFYARDSYARTRPALHEGPYALLSVRDSGPGIPPEIQDRVFEPFFTTKPPGSGSGLGLAMVHAIMRDHGGQVELESEVGAGTEVRCLFPALEGDEAEPASVAAAVPRGRGERVLLVDDEATLVRMGVRRLEDLGYRVKAANSAAHAVEMFRAGPTDFDLVLTDYTMPQMTGLELAREVTSIRPDIKIVMSTGFIEDLPAATLEAAGITRLLRKPQTLPELAQALRETLDR